MQTNKIISTLGCLALLLLAIYFVYGLLKIGGEGLGSLGFPEKVVEGMSDRAREKYLERLDNEIEKSKDYNCQK